MEPEEPSDFACGASISRRHTTDSTWSAKLAPESGSVQIWPLDLRSHEVTRKLLEDPSPLDNRAYKHREDLIGAALCAWTASLWHRHGLESCQVLGAVPNVERPAATIIAPARPEQRAP